MKILLFHPTLLPPKSYGGIERVVLWLAKGLLERGHEVFVACLAGSQLPKGCQILEVEKKFYSAEELLKILPKSLDVIHFMAPLSEKVWQKLPYPSLLTVHGNGQSGEKYPKNSVFLSQDHANRHRAKVYIYNGIDPAEFLYEPQNKGNHYLFLSKTNWRVKNLTGAMTYCKAAGSSLVIAGGSRPFLKRFTCLFNSQFTWAGPVSGWKKAQLLTQAKALVFPVIWPEPFGLVVAEALISGTPVIASPVGSLVEMIPSQVGLLPKTDEEWIEALQGKSWTFSSDQCREWAIEKFHFARMAESYEGVYQKVISGSFLHSEHPIAEGWKHFK